MLPYRQQKANKQRASEISQCSFHERKCRLEVKMAESITHIVDCIPDGPAGTTIQRVSR